MTDFTLEDAISKRRSHRAFDDRPLTLPLLHKLLWAAQGNTDKSGKRTIPSAHALHPLRLFVAAGRITDLPTGVYRASNDTTSLAPHLNRDVREDLKGAALDDQPWIAHAPALVIVCADMVAATGAFADQPPYGTRGRRYAYIEAGAAAQNIQLQAGAEGLASVLVAGFRDEATAEILNLPSSCEPLLHMCIGWPGSIDGTD